MGHERAAPSGGFHQPGAPRRGTILLIVVGLSSLLMVVFAVVLRQVGNESDLSTDVVADVQARMMLPAALSFILESARLGQHVDGETLGWTDVRPRLAGAAGPLRRSDSSLAATVSSDWVNEHGNLGASNDWPAPGSVYRADMFVWQRPPLAVRTNLTPNPVVFPAAWLEEYERASGAATAATILAGVLGPSQSGNGTEFGTLSDAAYFTHKGYNSGNANTTTVLPIPNGNGLETHWSRVWDRLLRPLSTGAVEAHRLLEVQPVADSVDDFTEGLRDGLGTPVPRQSSLGRAWFRVYRERDIDHDGNPSTGVGDDPMALSGHGVFIVTCGAGGTRGFRDWSEVQAAGATAIFGSESLFRSLQAQERLLWYRVEWSGFTGGGFDALTTYRGVDNENTRPWTHHFTNLAAQRPRYSATERAAYSWPLKLDSTKGNQDFAANHLDLAYRPTPLNATGTIKWIERLATEPERW